MWQKRTQIAASLVAIAMLLLSVFAALALDSNFSSLEVTNVSILDGNIKLEGLLYKPKSANPQNPAPAFVVAHGISGSKEMMSSIGLELARNGFVSLCLDLFGHGESQGSLEDGKTDPTFGVYSAVQYLKSQPFVDDSSLGLVGHSLGAGAVRTTVTKEQEIDVTILIGGGFGENTEAPEYGVFNSTFPKNLLVIVGKYDVLFDTEELTLDLLPPVFGTQQAVVPDTVYGEFENDTARKLVIPSTTHLLEIVDSTAISEIVAWANIVLGRAQSSPSPALIFGERETAILFALIALVEIALLSFFLVDYLINVRNGEESHAKENMTSHKWKLYTVWAIINLVLLLPMFGVGYVIQFPPLVFGSSIAWWMMATGLVGLLLVSKFSQRITGRQIALKRTLKDQFKKKDLLGAIISFAAVLMIVTILGKGFDFTFRIISPILRDFASTERALTFLTFIPFFLAYFVAEGLFLHYTQTRNHENSRRGVRNYGATVLGKILPFAVLLIIQYSTKILFGIWILPGFAGFLMEFLILIVPIFVITTTISWWFFRNTGRMGYGALLNTLLMALVASVIFPF